MSAFISYDFDDKAAYGNLSYTLKLQKIPYFDPKTMMPGKSLRDQLQEGILNCDVCIFLATKNSIESKWCLAEIGAFWGTGKTVVIYVSDPNISDADLPPQFKGDLTTDDIERVVSTVQQELFKAEQRKRQETAVRPRMVSEMTVATLYDVLTSLKAQQMKREVSEIFMLINEYISDNVADTEARIRPLIEELINAPREIIQTHASKYWPASFRLRTDTGEWLGFAKSSINHPQFDGYTHCLLVHCDSKRCTAVTAASAILERSQGVECDGIFAASGAPELGGIQQLVRQP